MAPEVVLCETFRDNPYDFKVDICSFREPEASGLEFTSFAKSQSKEQPSSSSKRNNKNDNDTIISKKQKQNVMIPRCLKLKEGKLT